MRDRNIFAELPVEEIRENKVSVSNSTEAHPKRNSNIRRKVRKIKHSADSPADKLATFDCVNIKEFEKLSIDSNLSSDQENMKNTAPKKSKPTVSTNLANINHKKATGADNWKAFLESNAKTKDPSQDEFTLNIGYEDESDVVKKTHVVAMDCEMVGIGEDKKENMLARVSIVNSLGECIYDTFVKPTATITDYRTAVSGVRPCDLVNAEKFPVVQKKVLEILRGKVLVGHAVHNDLIVLNIRHPRHKTRDTSRFKKFYQIGVGTPSLKKLTSHFLNVDIQTGEHNSIQDAQAAMQLYMLYRKEWEADVKQHRHATLRSRSIKKPKKTHKTKKKHRNY